jgi:hypothetical protein
MDHEEAVRLQAAEKYVLGDLAQELCDAYEEHYFDCQECATEVIATSAFVNGARDIFKEERQNDRTR